MVKSILSFILHLVCRGGICCKIGAEVVGHIWRRPFLIFSMRIRSFSYPVERKKGKSFEMGVLYRLS